MHWFAQLTFLHRAWRYRLRSEKFCISFLRSRDLRGKTVVDIGANHGVYSYWMQQGVGTSGHIIAFEPQPELAMYLRDLRESFGLTSLDIVDKGLSSAESELILHRPKNHWASASFQPREQDPQKFDLIPVKLTTLDTYFKNDSRRPIAFVKCDVEGHEYHVFKGGHSVLTEDRPELMFECFGANKERCKTFEFLQEIGYEGYCFYGDGLAPIAEYRSLRPKLHVKALHDFVFLPQGRKPTP